MKKFFTPGAIAAILSALLSLAAGIFYYVTDGSFGQGKVQDYFNPLTFLLLISCVLIVLILLLTKLPGLASFTATLIPGVCVALFFLGGTNSIANSIYCFFAEDLGILKEKLCGMSARAAYWHFADLGFEEKSYGMCPKFLTFLLLMVAAFIVGEIAVYLRKAPKAQALKD